MEHFQILEKHFFVLLTFQLRHQGHCSRQPSRWMVIPKFILNNALIFMMIHKKLIKFTFKIFGLASALSAPVRMSFK